MFNPIYDSHLQNKGIDYYSDSKWNNFGRDRKQQSRKRVYHLPSRMPGSH